MPVTKKSKSTKKMVKKETQAERLKKREAKIRAEKIHEFNAKLEYFYCVMDQKAQSCIDSIEGILRTTKQRAPQALMQLRMGEFLKLHLTKFSDWTPAMASASSSANLRVSADAGYFTEESMGSSASSALAFGPAHNSQKQKKGCTTAQAASAPGRRLRRSRSACDRLRNPSVEKPKPKVENSPNRTDRTARSKIPNPNSVRSKAVSLDRTGACVTLTPYAAFMRYPKPGEVVLSTMGSPVVAQLMPEKYANANIPVKDGMLFVKPKTLTYLQPELIQEFNAVTLNQIKILQDNLELIIKEANKAGILNETCTKY